MRLSISDREKPYLEYHAGRPVRKVSPRTRHALVQGAMLVILRRCAGSLYRVGTEWDCDLSAQLQSKTLLVPDVGAIAAGRLAALSPAERECPPFAPDLVVEVRSPNDRPGEREWKIRAYRDAGTLLVLDVAPDHHTIDAIAPTDAKTFRSDDIFEHVAAPWLRFEVSEAFADLL